MFGEGALLNVNSTSRHKTHWRTASGQEIVSVKPARHIGAGFLVAQLCASRIWFDGSHRLRCC